MNIGGVYALSNPAFKENLIKVGYTSCHPTKRCNHLYTTGVPDKFKIECFIPCDDYQSREKILHTKLDQYRYNNEREFFEISINDFINIVENELKWDLVKGDNISLYNGIEQYSRDIRDLDLRINKLNEKRLPFLEKLKKNNTKLVGAPYCSTCETPLTSIKLNHEEDNQNALYRSYAGDDPRISDILSPLVHDDKMFEDIKKDLDILKYEYNEYKRVKRHNPCWLDDNGNTCKLDDLKIDQIYMSPQKIKNKCKEVIYWLNIIEKNLDDSLRRLIWILE